MLASALVCSYAVISLSAMCSAPVIRKALIQLDRRFKSFRGFPPSFILLNGSLLLTCAATIGATFIPGRFTGIGFNFANEGHAAAQAVIFAAKSQQSVALLATLPSATGGLRKLIGLSRWRPSKLISIYVYLEQASDYNYRSYIVGGAIYSAYVILFFFTGLIPALFLNFYMRKRIGRLEEGLRK
jgi:hypothetical protein